ncbi:hypothetical protein [Helicobacter sp. T3_23-1056]
MSKLSKDLEHIKSEFQNDEKLLENAFKIERLFKKYKFVLLGIVSIIILWVGFIVASDYVEEKNAKEISQIYDELLVSPQNTILRENLKSKAPKLYDAFVYANLSSQKEERMQELEGLKESKNELIAQIAQYELASLKEDKDALNAIYSNAKNKKDTDSLKDFAKIQEAYLLFKNNDIAKAREVLKSVSSESSLDSIARQMEHYGIDKISLQSTKLESIKLETPQDKESSPKSSNDFATKPSEQKSK